MRNTDDRDVERFLKFFTEIDIEEISNIIKKEKNINNLKILLANEATKLLHGDNAAKNSAKTAKDTFEDGKMGLNLPEIKIKLSDMKKGINIVDLFQPIKFYLQKVRFESIANRGFKINDITIENEKKVLLLKDFEKDNFKLSYGKKKHYLVKFI